MALKLFQQEALDLIRKIWEEDIVEGKFSYKQQITGGERYSNGYYIESGPGGLEKKWREFIFSDVKSVLLLSKLDLISFKEDISLYRISLWGTTFEVTEKTKTIGFDDLETILLSYSSVTKDPILGEFEGVRLKESGEITHNKIVKMYKDKDSKQYLLLKALLSQKDKDKYMTIEMILEYLGLPTGVDHELVLPVKTYENLNQDFRINNVPIRIRKSKKAGGYMLEKETPLK